MGILEPITAIGLSLASIHMPHNGQQQFNPGITLEAHDIRAGIYRNSVRRTTAYIGYSYPLLETTHLRIGAFGALATGYSVPVIGALEVRVGQHVQLYLAPPCGKSCMGRSEGVDTTLPSTREHQSPVTLGITVRMPL
jgi:hypothetical protein